jgi:hypothetical protein
LLQSIVSLRIQRSLIAMMLFVNLDGDPYPLTNEGEVNLVSQLIVLMNDVTNAWN